MMPSEIIVEFPSPLTDKEKKMIYGYKGEVVRCKDCRKWCICHKSDDFYCADGERKEDEID